MLFLVVFPQFADFLEGFDSVFVEEAVTVRRDIKNECAAGIVHRAEIVIYHFLGRFGVACRHIFFPEPGALYGIAGH